MLHYALATAMLIPSICLIQLTIFIRPACGASSHRLPSLLLPVDSFVKIYWFMPFAAIWLTGSVSAAY